MRNYYLIRLTRRLAWLALPAGACAALVAALADWDRRGAGPVRLAIELCGVLLACVAFVAERRAAAAEKRVLEELRRQSLRERKPSRRGFEVLAPKPPATAD